MSRSTPITFRILDAFFRHLWLFLIVVTVVSGVTMTALYLRSKTFHATALTQVNPESVASALGVDQNNSWASPAQQNVDRLNDLLNDNTPGGFMDNVLQGEAMATNATDFLHKTDPGAERVKIKILDHPINLEPAAQDPRLTKLYKGLSIGPQSSTTYAIGLVWDDKDEATRIVQSLQAQYIEEVGAERQAGSVATGSFLDSQIASYRKRMRAAEQILINYRSHNIGGLPEAQSADISQLSSLQAQLEDMRISQHDAAMKRQALITRIAQVPPQTIMERTASESPLQTQIKELQAKRDTMLAGMTPDHPLVVQMDQQIAALQQQWRDKVRSGAPEAKGAVQTKTASDPEYQALQSQLMDANIAQNSQQAHMKLLQAAIAQYSQRVQKSPVAQRDLTDKTRDYSLLKAQYETLLQRKEQAQLKGSLDRVEASSTLKPIGSVYPEPTAGPKKQLLMFIGSLLLGIMVGIITIVLSEWLDRSLRYVTDAQRLLGVPVLGTVPETRALRTLPAPGGKSAPGALPAPGGRVFPKSATRG